MQPNVSLINGGLKDVVYKKISEQIPVYTGGVFENVCTQYMWKLLENGKAEFTEIGRWWGTDPKTKSQEEIDIMGTADKNTALFGECKWKNEKVDISILETLVKRSEIFDFKNKTYYLFSKSGFTDGCIELAAEMGNVSLVEYAEMLE